MSNDRIAGMLKRYDAASQKQRDGYVVMLTSCGREVRFDTGDPILRRIDKRVLHFAPNITRSGSVFYQLENGAHRHVAREMCGLYDSDLDPKHWTVICNNGPFDLRRSEIELASWDDIKREETHLRQRPSRKPNPEGAARAREVIAATIGSDALGAWIASHAGRVHEPVVIDGSKRQKPKPTGKRPTIKLTAEDVAWIRANADLPRGQVAEKFGVSAKHIGNIVNGNKWRSTQHQGITR